MPVVINEVVTEIVLGPAPEETRGEATPQRNEEWMELVVRRTVERVLDTLRREWEG
jgi:hypothetical protein